MCHYKTIRHAQCGDFSSILVYPCAVGLAYGQANCHDQREDQGTQQEDTLCPNCQRREVQAGHYGAVEPVHALLAEVKSKTRRAVDSGDNSVDWRGSAAYASDYPSSPASSRAGRASARKEKKAKVKEKKKETWREKTNEKKGYWEGNGR